MSFRIWVEEITSIRLEDTVREAGLEALDIQYLVHVRTDEKQGKEVKRGSVDVKVRHSKWYSSRTNSTEQVVRSERYLS